MKKPGFGFKENEITKIIGRKLLKNVSSKRISNADLLEIAMSSQKKKRKRDSFEV